MVAETFEEATHAATLVRASYRPPTPFEIDFRRRLDSNRTFELYAMRPGREPCARLFQRIHRQLIWTWTVADTRHSQSREFLFLKSEPAERERAPHKVSFGRFRFAT